MSERQIINSEEAISMLPDRETIHTYRQGGAFIVGADWRVMTEYLNKKRDEAAKQHLIDVYDAVYHHQDVGYELSFKAGFDAALKTVAEMGSEFDENSAHAEITARLEPYTNFNEDWSRERRDGFKMGANWQNSQSQAREGLLITLLVECSDIADAVTSALEAEFGNRVARVNFGNLYELSNKLQAVLKKGEV